MGTNANLKDVAAAAGVSISTASRALAGKANISETTRKRIEEIARGLNYTPNIPARGLRTAKTGTIGLVIPTLANPFFATMAAAIQESAAEHGFPTIITSYNEDPAALTTAVRTLHQHQVDGMIVVPSVGTASQLSALSQDGVPVVLVDRALENLNLPAVVSDPTAGIAEAVAHLVGLGHTRIGFLAGPQELSTGAGRLAAFQTVLKNHPQLLSKPEFIYYGGFELSQGRKGTQELLGAGVTGIIAGDSMMTLGAMEYCHANQVCIGKQLALIGFDDLVYVHVQPTPISVVDQDVVEMGRRALQILLAWMAGQPPPSDNIAIPTRFIPRASTECAPPGQASTQSKQVKEVT